MLKLQGKTEKKGVIVSPIHSLKKLKENVFCYSGLFFKTTFISFLKNCIVYNFHYKGSTARYVYEPKGKFFPGMTGISVL